MSLFFPRQNISSFIIHKSFLGSFRFIGGKWMTSVSLVRDNLKPRNLISETANSHLGRPIVSPCFLQISKISHRWETWVLGESQNVIHIDKTERDVSKNMVHYSLENLACISQAKGKPEELKHTKVRDDGILLDVRGRHRNLVVSFLEVQFGKKPRNHPNRK